jgi:hypothetical protein
MPVPPQVWSFYRDDNDVADTGPDLLLAAGAEICLSCLYGLDSPDPETLFAGPG